LYNADNLTLQKDSGPYNGIGSYGELKYTADMEGGGSGGPVASAGLCRGIHTDGTCSQDGSNRGTKMGHFVLHNELNNWIDLHTTYVDRDHPLAATGNGLISAPYDNVADGVANVVDGGVLAMIKGAYPVSETVTVGDDGKAVTIVAPVGTVTIGE
jgi:hypothetical protein